VAPSALHTLSRKLPAQPGPRTPYRAGTQLHEDLYLRRTRWRGARTLLYVDEFLLFVSTKEEALTLRHRNAQLLDRLTLLRHPTKGFWTLAQVGDHMGIDINTAP
jgi:hypothetical protein